ncbi:MAG: TetR family transcriptional regulator, partial [Actinobacteria bacterium]|nr:TetR family transcriptional regulator [Actinomycetota bacterium]
IDVALQPYQSDPGEMLARLRLIRCTPDLRSRQLDRLDQWKQVIGASLAGRLGADEGEITVAALVAAGLGAFDAALTRWSESDGAEDLVALIDAAFAAVAEPFPRLGTDA